MNLTISPVQTNQNNISFGFAKFSPEGMKLAKSASNIYKPLENETVFQNPSFFKTKYIKAPFATFIEETLPVKGNIEQEDIDLVTKAIQDCGTTNNAKVNANFVKQLLDKKTQKHILKLEEKQPDAYDAIITAEKAVFDKNWNNPLLSKKQTMDLLDVTLQKFQDVEKVTLTGVIEKSDAKAH